MAETVKTLFTKARALLDQYSDDGVIISDSEVIDMQKKFILFADIAHKELYRIENGDSTVPDALITIDDEVQINDFNAQGIAFYGAALIAPFETKDLVNFAMDEYKKVKLDARKYVKATEEPIEDVYPTNGSDW